MKQLISRYLQRLSWLVRRYRLAVMISGSVALALIMTGVNLLLYVKTGAYLLDLSRPGYEQARTQVIDDKTSDFSASGTITQQTLQEFRTIFNKQRKDMDALSSFGGDSLSDATLHMGANQPQ